MTSVSPNKPAANAPVAFLFGFLGGMAAHYLTYSPQGKKLRDQLLAIYDHNTSETSNFLIKPPTTPQTKTASVIDALDSPLILKQSRYATALLKRFKAKLAKTTDAVQVPEPTKPPVKKTTRSKRYFTQKEGR